MFWIADKAVTLPENNIQNNFINNKINNNTVTGVMEPHYGEDVGLGIREGFVWPPRAQRKHSWASTCPVLMGNGQV